MHFGERGEVYFLNGPFEFAHLVLVDFGILFQLIVVGVLHFGLELGFVVTSLVALVDLLQNNFPLQDEIDKVIRESISIDSLVGVIELM